MEHLGPYTRYEQVERINPRTKSTELVFRAVNSVIILGDADADDATPQDDLDLSTSFDIEDSRPLGNGKWKVRSIKHL